MANKKGVNTKKKTTKKTTTKKAATKKTTTKKETTSKTAAKKKNEVKYNNSIVTIIYVIIGIVIIVGGLYFVYDSVRIKKPEGIGTNISDEDIKKMGQEKFSWLASITDPYTQMPMFFKNQNVNINNIGNEEILQAAYKKIEKDDIKASGETNGNCLRQSNEDGLQYYTSGCYQEIFNVNILKEQVYKIFSKDINYSDNNFVISASKKCYKDNSDYKCILKITDVKTNLISIVHEIDRIEHDDNKIIVYSNLLSYIREESGAESSTFGIYKDVLATQKIDEIAFYNSIKNKGYKEINKQMINRYKDKLTVYKTTFILENNDFVWLKTEIER